MKLETNRFLQKLLMSDQFTLKGTQVSSVAIVMQELQADEQALIAAAAPVPPKAGNKIVSRKGK